MFKGRPRRAFWVNLSDVNENCFTAVRVEVNVALLGFKVFLFKTSPLPFELRNERKFHATATAPQ